MVKLLDLAKSLGSHARVQPLNYITYRAYKNHQRCAQSPEGQLQSSLIVRSPPGGSQVSATAVTRQSDVTATSRESAPRYRGSNMSRVMSGAA